MRETFCYCIGNTYNSCNTHTTNTNLRLKVNITSGRRWRNTCTYHLSPGHSLQEPPNVFVSPTFAPMEGSSDSEMSQLIKLIQRNFIISSLVWKEGAFGCLTVRLYWSVNLDAHGGEEVVHGIHGFLVLVEEGLFIFLGCLDDVGDNLPRV